MGDKNNLGATGGVVNGGHFEDGRCEGILHVKEKN